MTLEECPVSLDELKKHLRMPVDGTLDEELTTVLLASAEYIEGFCGRRFSTFEGGFPNTLKAAILLKASSLFENPADALDERTTASQRLANPRIWKTVTTE